MSDYVVRATAFNGSIRAFAANTKETLETARKCHNTSPVVSAALGRLLTAGAIMGTMLKGEKDIVTLQIKGNGPLKGLVVTADSKGNVKGYPFEPVVEIPLKPNGKLDVSGAIGKGFLSVIKDIGLKEPYSGQLELVSGEIAEDLTYYFAKSEQTPSAVGLGVLVDIDRSIKQSGGFIIQIMPGADETLIKNLEENISNALSVTDMLEEGKSAEEILEFLIGKENITFTEKKEVRFYCNCSRERVEKALISIGREEIKKIIDEDKKATLHCHFCSKEYNFTEDDLNNILKSI